MLNKTRFKSNTIKKTVILTAIASLFLAGCGSDQSYRKEVEGNDDYLNSPELKPLIVPQGVTIPTETNDFYIYRTNTEGAIGKQVDIRPPTIPISTIPNSSVSYHHDVVTLNVPANSNVWEFIPNSLTKRNIGIVNNDSKSIITASTFVFPNDKDQAIQASFIIQRQKSYGDFENITFGLKTLTRGEEDLSNDPIEIQRYIVRLFNMIMDDAVSESS